MKRFASIIIIAALLCGCGNNDTAPQSSPQSVSQNTAQITESSESSSLSAESTETSKQDSSTPELGWKDLVLVDYTLEVNCEGITDEASVSSYVSKAMEKLLASETYKKSAEHFTVEILSSEKPYIENPERFFDEKGTLTPLFKCAFVDDFDNDGTEEAFVALSMPRSEYTGERTFLYLIGQNGIEQLMTDEANFHGDDRFYILDYGCCKQLAISTGGDVGADRAIMLFGVYDGKAKMLFNSRSGGLTKYGPFLAIDIGWQGAAYYGFFDAKTREYYTTLGEKISADYIRAMDATDSIAASGEMLENYIDYYVIGGKYYYFVGMFGFNTLFIYEDGRFTKVNAPTDEYAFRTSTGAFTEIPDIDYDAALASMKTPEEAKLYR